MPYTFLNYIMLNYQIVLMIPFLPLCMAVSYVDLKEKRIPDKLLISGACFVLIFKLFQAVYLQDFLIIINCIAGAVIAAVPLFIIILLTNGGMGAGDMKYMALIGAWFGYKIALLSLVFAVVLSGTLIIVLLILRKIDRKTPIPFGPFISAGVWLVIIFEKQISAFF